MVELVYTPDLKSGAELSVCMRDDGFELITDKDQKVDLYERKKYENLS